MKIYTKTGDGGDTGLQGGYRMPKSHPRIAAYGTADEANAVLGLVLANPVDRDVRNAMIEIQNDLFVVGADLSNPDPDDGGNRVSQEMVGRLESCIDRFESELPPLTNFILPGGDAVAAGLHHARTVVRRAETAAVQLSQETAVNPDCLAYLNRLSDLLFVAARLVNARRGRSDTVWKGQKSKL